MSSFEILMSTTFSGTLSARLPVLPLASFGFFIGTPVAI
jgi:hypothetical protein